MAHESCSAADASLTHPGTWDGLWARYFREYQGDCRHAFYVAAIRRRRERRILEIGAGSFRDMAALNRWGFYCEGVDFSTESVASAREMMPAFSDRIRQMDAMELDYPDGTFDLTYHAGLWVLFKDADIVRLAAEQARVTRSRMLATVHNAHNRTFREKFEAWGREDPLYRVRFFEAEEIAALMRGCCRRVTVFPVTTPRIDRLIHLGHGRNIVRLAYRFYRHYGDLQTSERLMCIGEVRS